MTGGELRILPGLPAASSITVVRGVRPIAAGGYPERGGTGSRILGTVAAWHLSRPFVVTTRPSQTAQEN